MKKWKIDINCDVGEGVGNEADIFPYISSCNIACGGHAGNQETMLKVASQAKEHHLKVGSHPSYPDKANFGREVMDISNQDLIQSIRKQLADFDEVLEQKQITLHHIKAHGALYNQTANDKNLAKVYLEAIIDYKDKAILYVPFGSVIAKMAMEKGFKVWFEAFADRNYNSNMSLVSRKQENALIEEPEAVLQHILPIIKKSKVLSVDGESMEIKANTLCIHGDTVSALKILMYLSKELAKNQVQIQK
ncbi:LamB/YcsF family protein [Allomuricauda ruestringensis DSM 13258]|uniref:LamB/YcsF family protein n=1 Tax=Allomuricauda ruestringensis (strain DSM 13258 / CIP 107369 / LMG 19739 / B1) TaxID=886377 RepID=G2PME2_ALLRU|nr:5-oxoprolinase subunit PxpA [Allomuricauda ruestringensis]AEM72275.1 LamB/YcsF family protein [Allomuricauda ruestringensis DSM 13258]